MWCTMATAGAYSANVRDVGALQVESLKPQQFTPSAIGMCCEADLRMQPLLEQEAEELWVEFQDVISTLYHIPAMVTKMERYTRCGYIYMHIHYKILFGK